MSRSPRVVRALAAALVAITTSAGASPAHDVCADLGDTFAVGISSYSSALGWPEKAAANGVKWSFLYYYVTPDWDPGLADFIASKATIAKGLSATMVITFYNLYARGVAAGLPECTSDSPCVKAVLARPDLMKAYFDEFVDVLKAAKKAEDEGVTTLVHVEPDSWGFMMWTFGTDGQTDATRVPVMVKSSGHADVAAFSDDASGLARSLLALRDQYAPATRMGWHASNFRAGLRPEVVTSFYSTLGDWDVIVTEEPHIVTDATHWWNGLDTNLITANTNWFATVSSATHLPILIWQEHIGAMEYYLFADPGGPALLRSWMASGVAGMMWEQQCYGGTCSDPSNPDSFRGVADDDSTLLSAPPSSFGTGAAIDLRQDLAKYQLAPIAWPAGSICARSHADAGVAVTDSGAADAAQLVSPANGSGCGCRIGVGYQWTRVPWVASLMALVFMAAAARRRRASTRR